jgi:hypothetical protein
LPLNTKQIETTEASERTLRRFDGKGLYLEFVPGGGKWWRLKYRFEGKEKRLALGAYPEVSLKDARHRCDAARQLLAQGTDPSAIRREEKARTKAQRLATEGASKVQISCALNGTVEIWKGRSVVMLSADEARAVRDLLVKLT